MLKVLNVMLNILKMLLLLVCFVFTFYIIINMYRRLEKPFADSIFNFIPYILLFVLFSINFIFKQKKVNNCIFYNITCCLVFIMIGFAIFRTMTDKNMIAMVRLGYDINFNYFADIVAPMKIMLYVLSIANICLIVSGLNFEALLSKNKESKIETSKKSKK